MNEEKLIAEFTQAFDLIIKGDVTDLCVENKDLLALAGKISKFDYSSDSKICGIFGKTIAKKDERAEI